MARSSAELASREERLAQELGLPAEELVAVIQEQVMDSMLECLTGSLEAMRRGAHAPIARQDVDGFDPA